MKAGPVSEQKPNLLAPKKPPRQNSANFAPLHKRGIKILIFAEIKNYEQTDHGIYRKILPAF